MSIVAEYRVDRPEYMVALDEHPEIRLVIEVIAARDPETVLVTFWAYGDEFDGFEARLGNTGSIDGIETLSDGANGRKCYQLRLSAAELDYWAWAEHGGVLLDCTLDREGMTMRMRFPDRDGLIAYRERCEREGSSFRLVALRCTNTGPETTNGRLTSAQRTLLAAAVEGGYFEIPREITMAEIAEQLGISDQAASERLRRGLSTVLENGEVEDSAPERVEIGTPE